MKKRWGNIILLIASIIFYAWGEPVYVLIMCLSILFNYLAGILLEERYNRKLILIADLVMNLGVLIYFKYFNFLIRVLNSLNVFDLKNREIILPIGVSFFTFQAISYIIDIYHGKYKAEKNIVNMALFISFFPQLIAGPIVQYKDVGWQIRNRIHSVDKVAEGIRRFSYGLGKKVIIANLLAESVDRITAIDIDQVTGIMAWIVVMFYSLQIYYDFSGYSDMAIGLGKMFGFDIPENFLYPYLSKSISEFWRKWHVSLGNWFKEYIYIPLGGNRKGSLRTYINLGIVFLLTGIWHGADWNFILWGGYYSIFIIFERIGLEKVINKSKVISHIYTIVVFGCGWIIFYFTNIFTAIAYLERIFMPWRYTNSFYSVGELINKRTWCVFLGGIIGCGCIQLLMHKYFQLEKMKFSKVELLYCIMIVLICFSMLASNTYNPFIYFRF